MQFILLGFILQVNIVLIFGHGRMMEPPNRSSLWRLPKYQDLDPPVEFNYDDDQLYCGALGTMVQNGGKCGVCGDRYDQKRPRDNENGGIYGQGIIVQNYEIGQVIHVGIELTTNHWGTFTFNLCKLDHPGQLEPENCFEQYPLLLGDGSGKREYNLTQNSPGWYNTTVKLPDGLHCDNCVLRWHYRAGNNWEFCGDGDTEVGSTNCGVQEVFRSCSDISIGRKNPIPIRPKLTTTTESNYNNEVQDHGGKGKATIPPMRPPIGFRFV